jgi:hypothetical protein
MLSIFSHLSMGPRLRGDDGVYAPKMHMFMLSLWSFSYKIDAFFLALPKKQAKRFFYKIPPL